MSIYIVYFLSFISGVILFEFAWSSLRANRARASRLNRRMQLLEQHETVAAMQSRIRLERGLDRIGLFGGEHTFLHRLYTQSGLTMKLSNLVLACGAVATLAALALNLLGVPAWLQYVTFCVALAGLPLLVLLRTRARRIDRFTRQLPDALDIIVRGLRAGHPFNAAVTMVGREMPDPIGSEFGLIADELAYGVDINGVFAGAISRVGASELSLVAISLSISHRSGGDIGEILDNLSEVIRKRYMMKAKIRSLSAEGRFSAKFMSLFPLLMYLILQAMAPTYFDEIWRLEIENYFYGFLFVSTIIGNIILRKMVNFDF